jgi:hypothetical protein
VIWEGLTDRLLAVMAMLVAIRPLLRGSFGARSHISAKRAVVLLWGGLAALVGAVGILALRTQVLGEPFYLPTWMGGCLAFTGGMLGVSTLMARRGAGGLTEDHAIRYATQAAAMSIYVATPTGALLLLGVTRTARALLPWTTSEHRWWRLTEGLALLALCLVPRESTLGGLRSVATALGAG